MTDSLLDAIDKAAAALLKKVDGRSKLEGDQRDVLTEEVKAFEAVVKWAEKRRELVPAAQKPEEVKFAGIKRDFHAKTGNRRSSRSAAAEGGSAPVLALVSPGDDDTESDDD